MTLQEALAKAAIPYLPATYRRAIELLAEGPASAARVAEHLGMTVGSAYKLICILRRLRVVCTVEYIRTGERGCPTKMYGLGSRNLTPPTIKSSKERTKKYRDKKRREQLAKKGLAGLLQIGT